PSKKRLQQLEKIQRGFLWAGRAITNGGHCHVNWHHASRPLALGSLGVRDVERVGLALRLRWLWLSRTDEGRAWQGLDLQFSSNERTLFFASTYMTIGNGMNALFWEDRWLNGHSVGELMPLFYSCIPKRRRKARTVAEGLNCNALAHDIQGVLVIHEIGQYLQLWQLTQQAMLSDAPDQLICKQTASGIYSAQSCYAATFQGSVHSYSWKLIWKAWAPPRLKFFHWLANLDRCWTADRLACQRLQHHLCCLLCDQAPEMIRHLMLDCPFSRQAWHET
uniref:Reverse transcriptase zinc-binding domain-containing protein n=1 Tax=Aegilops tauschii subsp. strangulata TaxID=200361 RepID=A0A452XJ58_AEGTS